MTRHLPAICFSDGAYSSKSGSWVPVVDAESSVQVNGWARCCRSDTLDKMSRVFWWMLRGFLRDPFQCRPRAFPKQFRNLLSPT